MDTFTEQPALLEQIARGDQESMRLLIDRYSGLVWSLVRRKIANTVDAEDLVQEIFAEIWRSAGRYNTELGSEATFIGVIARRRVIDAIRKITRHAPTVQFDGAVEFDTAATSSESETSGIDLSVIHQILKSLSPQRRRVLELSIVRGLSHSQIVSATDMPLGTVKAHIRRGLEEIRAASQLKATDGEVLR
jgi:RNA polymerase sigma factor (sigma-70 family)